MNTHLLMMLLVGLSLPELVSAAPFIPENDNQIVEQLALPRYFRPSDP